MALLLKNNAVFLHIPKTGGTWVRSVLQEFDLVQGPLGHGHSDFERAYWHAGYITAFYDVLRIVERRPSEWPMEMPGGGMADY